jgi:hypothetical protein
MSLNTRAARLEAAAAQSYAQSYAQRREQWLSSLSVEELERHLAELHARISDEAFAAGIEKMRTGTGGSGTRLSEASIELLVQRRAKLRGQR